MAVLMLPGNPCEIKLVGFDVDGVLRDTGSLAYDNCCKAILELGGTPPILEDFVHDWGGSLEKYYRSCGVTEPDKKIREVNERFLHTHDDVGPFHDVVDTLEYLESCNVRMFALSGHSTERVRVWFERHGLHVRFKHIQGDGRDKINELREIVKQFSAWPHDACYIGDWGNDMRAARNAGVIPIGIAREQKTQEVLRRNGAVHVVDHLSEFVELVH